MYNDEMETQDLFSDDDKVESKHGIQRKIWKPKSKEEVKGEKELAKSKQESEIAEVGASSEVVEVDETESDEDFLNELIPFMSSIPTGIYRGHISNIKKIKNGKILVNFDLRIKDIVYPIINFYDNFAGKGNPLHRVISALALGKGTRYNDLCKKEMYISIVVRSKDGKTYENCVDFVDVNDYKKSDLETDKYGYFLF